MKKLLIVPFSALLLVGCGGGLPSECETTLKEYDNFISKAAGKLPEQMSVQLLNKCKKCCLTKVTPYV